MNKIDELKELIKSKDIEIKSLKNTILELKNTIALLNETITKYEVNQDE